MATTWSSPTLASTSTARRPRIAKAACTTGTEVPTVKSRATDGLDLSGLKSVIAHLEMARPTGTIDVLAALASGEKVTIGGHDFVAKPRFSTATATLATVVPGDKVTVNTVEFISGKNCAQATATLVAVAAGQSVSVNGIGFPAVASDAATLKGDEWKVGAGGGADATSATNLAAAITAARARCKCTAAAVGNVVTITAYLIGADGNGLPVSKVGAAITLSGNLEGAFDAAANGWPAGVGVTADADSATALAAAINACTDPKVKGVVTALAAANVVTLTSVIEGDVPTPLGSTGASVTCSGAKLDGAYKIASDEWAIMPTEGESAARLAWAIERSTDAGLASIADVCVDAALARVTISTQPGTAGNGVTLTKTGAHLSVSGATLAGGTVIGAGAKLKAHLLNPATGLVTPAPTLDVTLTAALGAQAVAVNVEGYAGRLQLLPDTVGAACSVYLSGGAA